mgnify:FL=1
MYPLFESLCVQDGCILNPQWHQARFENAYHKFFGEKAGYNLLDKITVPQQFMTGKVKLKIQYGEKEREIHFNHYKTQQINTIQLVHTTALDYTYKYSKREKLNALFDQRGDCDDVLIVRNGKITDSSYANAVFFDGEQWITPKYPLLEGTCRARLLANGQIKTAVLGVEDLKSFEGLKLINAMRDMDQAIIPIAGIVH